MKTTAETVSIKVTAKIKFFDQTCRDAKGVCPYYIYLEYPIHGCALCGLFMKYLYYIKGTGIRRCYACRRKTGHTSKKGRTK